MLYEILAQVFPPLFKVIWRFKVYGIENIPLTGGVVVAANHVSYLDPPLVGTAMAKSGRKVHFMAKEELFAPPMGRIYRSLGAFPVKRGASDMGAVRLAITLLKEGKVLGIFPEGTRSKDGKLGKAGLGTAMMAGKAGVPIIPTAIIGSGIKPLRPLWPRTTVAFGKPLYFREGVKQDKAELTRITEEMMASIATMLEQYRR